MPDRAQPNPEREMAGLFSRTIEESRNEVHQEVIFDGLGVLYDL